MKTRATCSRCKRPMRVCYCHTLKQLDNHWPVHILQHPGESQHGIGTAGIAFLSLMNSQLQVGESFTSDSITVDLKNAVLIYPGEDANSLDILRSDLPQTLIFMDASWRKSYRMLMESPDLQALPKVGLKPESVSRYRIRKSRYNASLSTVEAIAYTLGFLERNKEKYLPLLNCMDWMIEKQISLMGEEVFRRNYCE